MWVLVKKDNIFQKLRKHVPIGNVQVATIENKIKTPRREKFLPNKNLPSFFALVESLENGVIFGHSCMNRVIPSK